MISSDIEAVITLIRSSSFVVTRDTSLVVRKGAQQRHERHSKYIGRFKLSLLLTA